MIFLWFRRFCRPYRGLGCERRAGGVNPLMQESAGLRLPLAIHSRKWFTRFLIRVNPWFHILVSAMCRAKPLRFNF